MRERDYMDQIEFSGDVEPDMKSFLNGKGEQLKPASVLRAFIVINLAIGSGCAGGLIETAALRNADLEKNRQASSEEMVLEGVFPELPNSGPIAGHEVPVSAGGSKSKSNSESEVEIPDTVEIRVSAVDDRLDSFQAMSPTGEIYDCKEERIKFREVRVVCDGPDEDTLPDDNPPIDITRLKIEDLAIRNDEHGTEVEDWVIRYTPVPGN